jgi:hypothetical protein
MLPDWPELSSECLTLRDEPLLFISEEPKGDLDQVVIWYKGKKKPAWMTAEAFAALPAKITVRELRRVAGAECPRVQGPSRTQPRGTLSGRI